MDIIKSVNEVKRREDNSGSTITITHVSDGSDDVVKVRHLTGLNVGMSPADLAKVFLEFISIDSDQYQAEELRAVSQVISNIHQRHYKKS